MTESRTHEQSESDALRDANARAGALHFALAVADAAINPTDKAGISLFDWNERLKKATAVIRQALALAPSPTPTPPTMSEPRREILADGVDIWLGDCREVLPLIGRVDAVVTDPPYGVDLGEHGAAKDGRRDRVLIKGSYASYIDSPENFSEIVAPSIRLALSLAKRGAVYCAGHRAWELPRPDLIGGTYLPAAQGRNKWGFTSLAVCLFYGSAPSLQKGAKATVMRSTAAAEKSDHPCPKPIEWMRWAVDLASEDDETVLDPFMGSGTTGVASVKLGRKFIGIEIDPGYFDIARRRITEALKQPDFFVERPALVKQEAFL